MALRMLKTDRRPHQAFNQHPRPTLGQGAILAHIRLASDYATTLVALHPGIKRAHSLTEAAQAYSQGAGALPNPILQLSGVVGDPDERSNSISQTLEIAGQPGLRRRTAEEAALASAASEEALRREVS